jgi:predicted negative regulator of RcsB-dependent stress response
MKHNLTRELILFIIYVVFLLFPLFFAHNVYRSIETEKLQNSFKTYNQVQKQENEEKLTEVKSEKYFCDFIDINKDEIFIKTFFAVFLSAMWSFRRILKIGTMMLV